MPHRAFLQVLFLTPLSSTLVAQTPSAVSLFSSPNPATYGAAVTLTATVTPSAATGKITFYDGAVPLGDSAISGGQALLITHLLTTGSRSLRAHYSGDSTYSPGDAPVLAQTVNSLSAESFSAAVTYPVSDGAGAVATGDFNGDGKIDLAVCANTTLGTSLNIFLGNGDGTFQQFATYNGGTPYFVEGSDRSSTFYMSSLQTGSIACAVRRRLPDMC